MVPDIIEYDRGALGSAAKVPIMPLHPSSEAGYRAAIWAMGQALAWAGYITPTLGEPLQPAAQVVQAIRLFPAGAAILLVLAIICAWYYPITAEPPGARGRISGTGYVIVEAKHSVAAQSDHQGFMCGCFALTEVCHVRFEH